MEICGFVEVLRVLELDLRGFRLFGELEGFDLDGCLWNYRIIE